MEEQHKNKNQLFVKQLLAKLGTNISTVDDKELASFANSTSVAETIDRIRQHQQEIMEKWKIRERILTFERVSLVVANGNEHKPYLHQFDTAVFLESGVTSWSFQGLNEIGLTYNPEAETIEGTPTASGDFNITMLFQVEGEDEHTARHTKVIRVVINPDPKSLWKNIPSNQEALYWKADNRSASGTVGDRQVVVSSKRGRSHQNVGSFRDDDFAYQHFDESGWTVLAVSDGAGSASLSRKGSLQACEEVLSYFEQHLPEGLLQDFEAKLLESNPVVGEPIAANVVNSGKQALYNATLYTNKKLQETATSAFSNNPELFDASKPKPPLEYFHATLVFAAVKKFDFGYVFLTFGVGDCPIGLVNKDQTHTKLLNWLDVGEFGGGTRFITQPEIFHSEERPMSSRFNVHLADDFSYLFLMTDGIYDPKFEVEANLEKPEKWQEFIADLKGNNEDNCAVDFDADHLQTESNLNRWMDFWSKGNHDDRTLAILY